MGCIYSAWWSPIIFKRFGTCMPQNFRHNPPRGPTPVWNQRRTQQQPARQIGHMSWVEFWCTGCYMGPEMCKNHCPLCRRLGCKRFVQSETCKQSRSGSLWWIKKPKRFDIFRKTVAICVSMYLSPYLSINQRFNQPINESIHPFIHPPIYIFVFWFCLFIIFFVRKQAGHSIWNIYMLSKI